MSIRKAPNKYFAAANTYGGFRSHFDRIFNSDKFEKVDILKGGPGTGKSSFMKKISNSISNINTKIDTVFCSSDSSSLDGLIVKRNEKQIALIDGTAPHIKDPSFPGAVDQIINLGEHWDECWLRGSRNEISRLCKEKSNAYHAAYSFLKIAGTCFEEIYATYRNKFNIPNIIRTLNEYDIKPSGSDIEQTEYLLSAFGKDGIQRLNTKDDNDVCVIKINGNIVETLLFMTYVKKYLSFRNIDFINHIFVLDNSLSEEIDISGLIFTIHNNVAKSIDTSSFYKIDALDAEKIKYILQIHDDALSKSQRQFKIASELHFRLEEIYTSTMNFEHINIWRERIAEEIENILD